MRRIAWMAAMGLVTVGISSSISAQDAAPHQFLLDREQVAALVRAFNEGLAYVPGEVLVKFRTGLEPAQQASALSVVRGGLQSTETRWIGNILHVRAPGEDNAEALADVLSRQPEVEWVQPNYLSRLKAVPNDPSYPRQWNFDLINMPLAWDISGTRSSGVTVAVIDSGVTVVSEAQLFPLWTGSRIASFNIPFRQNPDIAAARFGLSRDFVFWTGPVLDMVGHGTHVAGTVLQETNNALGLAGIASHARLMPLKACVGYWELQIVTSARGIPGFVNPNESGGCPAAAVVSAIRYAADNGAKIINLSFGSPGASPALLDALQYAVQRGVFIAMAMGNEFETGNPTEYPAAYAPQVNGAMSVGAVNRSRRRASYSNTGSHIEVVAPGGDVRDGGLSGLVYQAGLFDPDFDPATVVIPRFDRYYDQPNEGTSMAAPHVAGLAALLLAQGITNPAAIEAAIKRFSVDLGPPGHDVEYGHGLIDARAALRGLGVAR
jgi:serine protease